MTSEKFQWYVGIDSGSQKHWVCLVDGEGQKLATRSFEHSGKGIAGLMEWLDKMAEGKPETLAVAIETPRGAMVENLVEHQYGVFSINPKQVDRFRDRYSVSGAKDDGRDAFVLGDCLRTDRRCFHQIRLDEPQIYRLRELSRFEEDLQQQSRRHANQLWEQLNRYYPQMLRLSPGADEGWLWDLIQMAPLPVAASRLTKPQVEELLHSHRIRRVDAEEVLQQLRQPALRLAPGAAEAASEHVLLLLPQLQLLKTQREEVAKRISNLLTELSTPSTEAEQREHRDAEVLLSLPGVGRVVAATMLAEAAQPLGERDYHALRCLSGIAPVTRQSGKKKIVLMRRGCNIRLRNAMYYWSLSSLQCDEHARQQYDRLRKEGNTHGQALRAVADRWLRVLVSMLGTGTFYDPKRRTKSTEEKASAAA